MSRGIDVDQVIADQARRAGLDLSKAPERRIRDTGPIRCSGKLSPMRDLVLVKVRPSLEMIGGLYVTDVTQSTRNQLHKRAKVVARGSKAADVKPGDQVIVSEYFGDEILMDGQAYRLGRERDIVAIEAKDGGLFALGDRMILDRIEAVGSVGSKKAGNLLYLPDDAQEMQFRAKVVSHGSKCSVVCGDQVLVPKSHSVVVRIDDRERYWINEDALLGVL